MPRDGSGGYQLPINAWNPATNGVSATPAEWQQLIDDLAAAVAGSVSADGQTPLSGNIRMGNNQLTALKAPTGQGQALRWDQLTKGSAIASAGTITIPNEGTLFDVTGTTTITTIDAAFPGRACWLRFADVVTLKKATWLILPGGKDYKTAAGEIVLLINISPTAWQLVTSGGGSDGFNIGDFLDTARNPGTQWLRRNGSTYPNIAYPALAALLPPAPIGMEWTDWDTDATSQSGNIVNGALGFSFIGYDATSGTRLWSSEDGAVYSFGPQIMPGAATSSVSMAYGQGRYVIGDLTADRSVYSGDGVAAFTKTTTPGVSYRFFVFDEDSNYFYGTSPNEIGGFHPVVRSIDGVVFTERTGVPYNIGVDGLSLANGILFAYTSTLETYTSTNGAGTWMMNTAIVIGQGGSGKIVHVPNDAYYYLASDGVRRSVDLTSSTLSLAGTYTDIAQKGGVLVASGAPGFAYKMSPLSPWVNNALPGPSSGPLAIDDSGDREQFLMITPGVNAYKGTITPSGYFIVPDDNPANGWIRALD